MLLSMFVIQFRDSLTNLLLPTSHESYKRTLISRQKVKLSFIPCEKDNYYICIAIDKKNFT